VFLERILERKRDEVAGLRPRRSELEEEAGRASSPRGFVRHLREPVDRVSVIAEFKRRSPSAGEIAPGAEPAATAAAYREAGARAMSVLTDGPGFGGSLEDLREARGAADLPVLRKDFLLDPVQLLESRAAGADGVLLIVRALEDDRLRALLRGARELGMEALVEVHDGQELERAVEAGARCIGVNARDLESFAVDLDRSEALVGRVPGELVAVAESGIRGPEDVDRMGAAGADAVLVGTALMGRPASEVLTPLVGRPRSARGTGAARG
jgi:indole-3-glycerol phosphate synthase